MKRHSWRVLQTAYLEGLLKIRLPIAPPHTRPQLPTGGQVVVDISMGLMVQVAESVALEDMLDVTNNPNN